MLKKMKAVLVMNCILKIFQSMIENLMTFFRSVSKAELKISLILSKLINVNNKRDC